MSYNLDMLSYLSGIIQEHTKDGAIVLVNGVGYECYGDWLNRLPITTNVTCYTYQYYENQTIPRLIAVPDLESRSILIELLSVSGIGPKMAGRIVSELGKERLLFAITNSDVTTLSTVKGLGKKTAQKIILELGKKLVLDTGEKSTYYEALGNLGFTPREIEGVLRNLDVRGMNENQVIATVLKTLGGRQ